MGSKRRSECAAIIKEFQRTQRLPMSARPFCVTREWVHRHINFGSPTAKQLSILGEPWLTETGWLQRIVGLMICETSRIAFEASQKTRRHTAVAPSPAAPAKDAIWKWTFGKHSGRLLSETPMEYLDWVAENFKNGEIKDMAVREIHRRNTTSKPAVVTQPALFHDVEQSTAEDSITQGQYDCSRMFDPNSDWTEAQPWDGSSPPWEDRIGSDTMFDEFRAIVGS